MDITIRPYQEPDLPICRSLWADLTEWHRILYEDTTIGGDDPGSYFDRYIQLPNLAQVWVAETEGQVIGMTGLLINGEEAEIEPVIVTANRRAGGVGRLLGATAVDEARKRGVRFLSVKPVARNVEAIHFFVQNGFRLVGQVELFQELDPDSGRSWEAGLTLHGNLLGY
jgi:N-acetylglutamate synthase-like GNAT family acetyltransferase